MPLLEMPLNKVGVERVGADDSVRGKFEYFFGKEVFWWTHEGELLLREVLLICGTVDFIPESWAVSGHGPVAFLKKAIESW